MPPLDTPSLPPGAPPPPASPQPVPPIPPIDAAGVIADELKLPRPSVEQRWRLLAEGATVPFIARYRKEATGGLDEVQIARSKDAPSELVELDGAPRDRPRVDRRAGQADRRAASAIVAHAVEDRARGPVPALQAQAAHARDDRPRARPRAAGRDPGAGRRRSPAVARGAGARPSSSAEKEVPDVEAALAGARDIVAERIAEQRRRARGAARARFEQGTLRSRAACGEGNEPEARSKFKDYFDFDEPAARASRRTASWPCAAARTEGVPAAGARGRRRRRVAKLARHCSMQRPDGAAGARASTTALVDAYKRLLTPSIEVDVRLELKERADAEAIDVFAENLRHLLLAAPLGGKRVLALDPGLRTGCKFVGRRRDRASCWPTTVIYPTQPQRAGRGGRRRRRAALCRSTRIEAIAVGNGTGGPRDRGLRAQAWRRTGAGRRRLIVVGQRGGRLGLLGVARSRARSSPTSTSPCAARSRSPGACRIRWPSW